KRLPRKGLAIKIFKRRNLLGRTGNASSSIRRPSSKAKANLHGQDAGERNRPLRHATGRNSQRTNRNFPETFDHWSTGVSSPTPGAWIYQNNTPCGRSDNGTGTRGSARAHRASVM